MSPDAPIERIRHPGAARRRWRGILGALVMFWLTGPAGAAPQAPKAESVSFHNGNVTLSGTLYLPAGTRRHPGVVVFHAAGGGTRDFHAYRHLTTALPAAGFAVLLFDRRDSGASVGNSTSATFQVLAADGVAAVRLLRSRDDIEPGCIGVWGLSQGGWLAPLSATMSDDIAFVVAVSAPGVSPAVQMDYAAARALRAIDQPPEVVERALHVRAVVNDYYRGRGAESQAAQAVAGIRSESWFGQVFLPNAGDLPSNPTRTKWYTEMDYDPLDAISRVRVPMIFLFAETDAWVPVEQSITNVRRAARASSAVTIARIRQTDHFMETGPSDSAGPTSEEYVARLLEWLERTVGQRCRQTIGKI